MPLAKQSNGLRRIAKTNIIYNKTMKSFDEIRKHRIEKLNNLKSQNIEAYPASVDKIYAISKITEKFKTLEKKKNNIALAGRVTAKREHGGSIFIDIFDGEKSLQSYFKKDSLGNASFKLFQEIIDIGDFIYVKGRPFTTKRGEKSIEAKDWKILSKSLRPLPEKWHGLQDIEERFRKRYLDILMNEITRKNFAIRSKVIFFLRDFLNKEGFVEVETPILQPKAGGALARPFKTHHNALDIDLYLRIAPELYLKRLLVGGYNKIYEIGRNFRNEGIDSTHNPEFTMLELYQSYADSAAHMDFVEKLLKYLVKNIFGKLSFKNNEKVINLSKKFKRISFSEVLSRYAFISDFEKLSDKELALKLKQLGLESEKITYRGKIADEIFKKVCRPKIIEPTFVTHHPQEISPLAKPSKEKGKADRYQLIAGGLEIVNGFSELNDPFKQREFFESQQKLKEKGEQEITPLDEEFLEALEYGMPPAAGLGIGIDRLVMLLSDQRNIKEVILFPTLKPK